jgi:hypothetical protein
MNLPNASPADQRYFERVVEDCERLLGPEIELRALDVDTNGDATNGDVVLRLTYRLGTADWTTEGRGETIIEAHAALRDQLVLDRVRVGVRAIYKARKA